MNKLKKMELIPEILNHWIGNNVKAFDTYINLENYYE
jgi:hypothetical protein